MLIGMDEHPYHRITCDGQRGLAHFECVVIQEAQEWTANPGRRIS
jgi:hypothetical protein